jgi:tRNA A37 methylthiotransferase MiaB
MRPGLLEAMVNTPKVASYFDLSFQHASAPVLRRMRRFGSSDEFLALVQSIRAANPEAGVRSNVIVGFPGETEEDLNILCDFITEAQMDVVGIFGYSDEQDTEALTLDGKLPQREIDQRVEYVTSLVDEIISQRAEDRIGQTATVIVESLTDGIEGRTEFQGPETDGMTTLIGISEAAIGDVYEITIVDSEGADLVGQVN